MIDQIEKYIEFCLCYIIAPFVLLIGIFGNTISLIIFFKKKFSKVSLVFMYRYLFIFNSISLFELFNFYLCDGLGKYFKLTLFGYKLIRYLTEFTASFTPWIIFYLLCQRIIFLSNKSRILSSRTSQNIFLLIISIVNGFSSLLNESSICQLVIEEKDWSNYIIINIFKVYVFFIFIILSFYLLIQRSLSHYHEPGFYSLEENRLFKLESNFTLMISLMGFLYVLLNLPVYILLLDFKKSNIIVFILKNIHTIGFMYNFYLFWKYNQGFCNVLYSMLRKNKIKDISFLQINTIN